MATTGNDFAQTPDAAERAALPQLKTLYVTASAGSPPDVAGQQLASLFPDLDITIVGTVASALAEARKDRSLVALLVSPQLPQNETLALIVSLRRDHVPIAIVPVVHESQRDFFASAVAAGADDVILLRGDTLVGGHETLNRIRQSPHVTGGAERYRLRVLYAGKDDAVWTLLQETPFVVAERAACTADGACLIRTSASPDGRLRCDAVVVDDPAEAHPLQVLKSIREQASDLPIIVLAPAAAGEIETAALDLGADDTLVKNAVYRRRLVAALRRWHQRIEITGQHAALRTREQRLRQIVESLPEGLGVIAENGTIRAMNNHALAIFGGSRPTDLVGRAIGDLVVEDERKHVLERLHTISGGEAGTIQMSVKGIDGTARTVVLRGVALARDSQAGRGVLAVIRQPEPGARESSSSEGTVALQTRLADLERERQTLEERVQQAESDASVRTDADAALADTLVAERAAWDDARRALEQRLDAALEEGRDWKDARRVLEARAERSEAAVADLLQSLEDSNSKQIPKTAIDDLRREIGQRKEQYENDRAAWDGARQDWDAARQDLETRLGASDRDRSDLRQQLDAGDRSHHDLKQKLAARDESQARFQQQLDARDRALADLQQQLEGRDRSHADLRQQLDVSDRGRADLQQKLEAGDRSRDELQKQLEANEPARQELAQRIEIADRARRDLEEKLNTAEQRIAESSSELQELRAEAYQTRTQSDGEAVQLTARLRQARRLEEVGTLASSMAPEVQRLLTEVAAEAQALAERLDRNDDRRAATDAIAAHAAEARDLLRQLLAFSVRQAGASDPVELGDALRQVEPVLRQLLGEQMPLHVKQIAPAVIGLTRNDVHQLVTALVIAARDVLPIGGGIDVDITRVDLTEGVNGSPTPSGQRAALTVTAIGYGVQPPVLPPAVEVLARRCDAIVKPTREGQRRAGLSIYFPLAQASDADSTPHN